MDMKATPEHQNQPAAGRRGEVIESLTSTGQASEPAPPGENVGAAGAPSTIKEMARDFGVSLRALRFYEDRGLLHPRRDGRTRLYGAQDRRNLKSILKGKRLGFTLSEIHDMLRSAGRPHLAIGRQERAAARFDFDDSGLESELDLALPAEQIVAQIGYLERQRNDLDAAIIALRCAHRRMQKPSGQEAAA
jgi:DNA-binding transcriptional MerR regulator